MNTRKRIEGETATNKDREAHQIVQTKPPICIMIVKEEPKVRQLIGSKVDVKPVNTVKQPPKRKNVTGFSQPINTMMPEAEPQIPNGKNKPDPPLPANPNKPYTFKRRPSAGLMADSVLRTKTGHLREFYTLGEKLGHGQYGTTFRCVEKETGKEYASKSIAKRKLLTMEDVEDVRGEIQIMHHLAGHPNIISIKSTYEDPSAVHLVMELCSGGELFDRILKRGHCREGKAAQLVRTIIGVVEACHSLGFMHRDLKPENFLFVNEQEDSPLKTIDFGLSTFFKPGSPYYVAPEVLRKHYGPEADIWSVVVILYILLSGARPFWGGPWPHISESAKDLVRKMLVKDRKGQLTAHEVLCHAWVQEDGMAPNRPLDSAVLIRLKQFSSMNKLQRMALSVIVERLSEEEITGLKEFFRAIDTDNSGHITFEGLKSGLKRFGANLSEDEIHDLMKSADINNNGTIDCGEFLAATLHLNKVQREEYLFAACSYFDKDGSGYITHNELQQACEEFGMEDFRLDEMIEDVDQDKDGRIDYNEFVVMMQKGSVNLGTRDFLYTNFSIRCLEVVSVY